MGLWDNLILGQPNAGVTFSQRIGRPAQYGDNALRPNGTWGKIGVDMPHPSGSPYRQPGDAARAALNGVDAATPGRGAWDFLGRAQPAAVPPPAQSGLAVGNQWVQDLRRQIAAIPPTGASIHDPIIGPVNAAAPNSDRSAFESERTRLDGNMNRALAMEGRHDPYAGQHMAQPNLNVLPFQSAPAVPQMTPEQLQAQATSSMAALAAKKGVQTPGGSAWDGRAPGTPDAYNRPRSTTEMLRGAMAGQAGGDYVGNPGGRDTIDAGRFAQHMAYNAVNLDPAAHATDMARRKAMVVARAQGNPISAAQAAFQVSNPETAGEWESARQMGPAAQAAYMHGVGANQVAQTEGGTARDVEGIRGKNALGVVSQQGTNDLNLEDKRGATQRYVTDATIGSGDRRQDKQLEFDKENARLNREQALAVQKGDFAHAELLAKQQNDLKRQEIEVNGRNGALAAIAPSLSGLQPDIAAGVLDRFTPSGAATGGGVSGSEKVGIAEAARKAMLPPGPVASFFDGADFATVKEFGDAQRALDIPALTRIMRARGVPGDVANPYLRQLTGSSFTSTENPDGYWLGGAIINPMENFRNMVRALGLRND